MAKPRTSGNRTRRVRTPKPIAWYDPSFVREMTKGRTSAYKAAIKIAAEQQMDFFTVHRSACAVMSDDEDECTCIPVVMYMGITA